MFLIKGITIKPSSSLHYFLKKEEEDNKRSFEEEYKEFDEENTLSGLKWDYYHKDFISTYSKAYILQS